MTSRSSIDPVTDKRFQLVRPLGTGATGAVFLALDRETGEQVALKKLFKLDQKSVQRFKREFRSLADIHHPNLVKLYDLHRGQDAWLLTMEYVAGRDFSLALSARASLGAETLRPSNDNGAVELLRVFYELACGVQAIHRAGMLHRDLKPTNVMIGDDGRVVVLDFGLVREIDGSNKLTQDGAVAGTPAYMPPEQALGETLSEASDWYAFGTMLYEAISGVLPIDGRNATQLLQRKLSNSPRPLESGAPRPVLDLCMALLAREPSERPSGAKVLDVLTAEGGASRVATVTAEHPLTVEPGALSSAGSLFGRDAELAQLHACSDEPRACSMVVHVRGTSGSGKSTLVECFLDEIAFASTIPTVVLRSRCYEREAMPFKALDGVMDVLVTYLSKLDDLTCAHLLPPDILDLTRVFPALERLHAVQRLQARHRTRGDETQIRHRAEQALRKLMTSVAATHRVLLWIDDLQWGDADSASVLRDWLERPLDAPVIIALSYRSEEMQTSSTLRMLLDRPELTVLEAQRTIDLLPLSSSDVRSLCLHRLQRTTQPTDSMIERIVQESQGNPFWAQQLAAIAEAKLARRDTSLDGLSVDALIEQAGSYLGQAARGLLNVLAIAGRPVKPQLALAAAGIFSAGRAHIHALRGLRLVRTRDVGDERYLEVYHDRVRETIQAALPREESERLQGLLLLQLQAARSEDYDWLHTLALGAGQRAKAFQFGMVAAERASKTLAFERAAELFSRCVELGTDELEPHILWMKLAAAQAHCRRGYDAAKAYAIAAQHAPAEQSKELLQLSAAHLVRSGRFEEGERMIQRVLKAQHMRVPRSRLGLFAAIGWEYLRIALRSLDVPARNPVGRAQHLAHQSMFYATLSIETQLYYPLRSALFQARALRMALDYGTLANVGRALCLSAAIACVAGTQRAARRADALLRRAGALLERTSDPDVQLEFLCARAVCAQFVGDIEHALEPANAVEQLVSSRPATGHHGDYYYMFTVQMVQVSALQSLGRLLDARKVLHEHAARVRATDNVAANLQVAMNRTVDEQALNMCKDSRARLDAEYLQLPRGEFGVLTVAHLLGVMRAACATRDYEWAFTRLAEFWQPYLRSVVHRSAFVGLLAHMLHVRLLLNHHVDTGARGDPELLVRDDLKHLSRYPQGLMTEVAIARTRARIAFLKGDHERAVELARYCLARLDSSPYRQETEHDRYTLGLLLGGDEGMQLIAAARARLHEYGVSDPDANLAVYVPELMPRGR